VSKQVRKPPASEAAKVLAWTAELGVGGGGLVGSTSVLCYWRLGSSVAASWPSSRGRKYVMVYMHPKIGNAEETVDGRYPSNQIEEHGGA
jgi:hypothetical protein